MGIHDLSQWLARNTNSLVTGAIGSLLAVVLQTTVMVVASTLTYFLTFRMRLRRLLDIETTTKEIILVSGSVDGLSGPGIAFLAGPDASAAVILMKSLESVYPRARIRHQYCGKKASLCGLDEDLVTIGGPVFNGCTNHILKSFLSRIHFDDHDRLISGTTVYECSEISERDYGVVLRVQNPMATSKKAIVVAGCGSNGVLAASMVFEQGNRFAGLRKSFARKRGFWNGLLNRDFLAVIECNIVGNTISNVSVLEVDTIHT
jgi:hypothetical protein